MITIPLPDGSEAEVEDSVQELTDGALSIIVHRNEAVARTIERWKRKEAFEALRDAIATEMQAAENALWQVFVSRLVDDARGESLNILGRIVGEARNGRDDPSYRVRIRARVRVNQSFGRVSDLVAVLALLDTAHFTITLTPPAAYLVTADAPLSGFATATELAELLGEATAVGVGGTLTMWTDTEGFRLADTVAATVVGSDLGDSVPPGTVPKAHIPDVRNL